MIRSGFRPAECAPGPVPQGCLPRRGEKTDQRTFFAKVLSPGALAGPRGSRATTDENIRTDLITSHSRLILRRMRAYASLAGKLSFSRRMERVRHDRRDLHGSLRDLTFCFVMARQGCLRSKPLGSFGHPLQRLAELVSFLVLNVR